MGTSASSSGPGPGVPFDPPWLDNIAPPSPVTDPPPHEQDADDEGSDDAQPTPPDRPSQEQPELAPARRFANARRAMGRFAETGLRETFRKAAGHYSRTGMGGARNVAHRMRTSAAVAASVFGMLQSVREQTDPSISEWVASLVGRDASAREIAEEVIRRALPAGGSQDEVASQESMAQALEDLIVRNGEVDLLHLSDDDIWTLVESFLGYEAFSRLCLDIGQVFEKSALSPLGQVERMNEMQDYLKADLGAQVERLREDTPNATSSQLRSILERALANTFAVYEGEI